MSEQDEEQVLICMRVDDLPVPPVSSVIKKCSRCGENVWQALSSPPIARLICMPCIPYEVTGHKIAVNLPTPEQAREILEVLKKNELKDADPEKENQGE
jgi:hypothetical protein